MSALAFLGRNATRFMAASVFLALVAPDLASFMRPLLGPAVWGLLFLAMVRLDWTNVARRLRRIPVVAATVFWLLALSPAATWLILDAVGWSATGVAQALVLMAAAPPLMSTPALALILGLDASLAFVALTATIFLSPLVLPAVTLELLGLELQFSSAEFMLRLTILVGSSLAAAVTARRIIGRRRLEATVERTNGLVVALMLVFAIAIMDGVTARLVSEPVYVLTVLVVAFAANGLFQLISATVFYRLGWPGALTIGFVSGNRNMGLLLAVLPAGIDPDVTLYFALAQFPIYVYPWLLRRLYARLASAEQR